MTLEVEFQCLCECVCLRWHFSERKCQALPLYSINFNNFEKFDILIISPLRFILYCKYGGQILLTYLNKKTSLSLCFINVVCFFFFFTTGYRCLIVFLFRFSLVSSINVCVCVCVWGVGLGWFSNCEKSFCYFQLWDAADAAWDCVMT